MTYYNEANVSVACASWAPVVGFTGCAMAVVFASEFTLIEGECFDEVLVFVDGTRTIEQQFQSNSSSQSISGEVSKQWCISRNGSYWIVLRSTDTR